MDLSYDTSMTKELYLQPYRSAAKRHGSDFSVTLWANQGTQEIRFQVFTEMYFLAGKRILDAGCSRGDLAAYLLNRDVQFEHYLGIDALSEVIEYAADRNLPRCEFHQGDFIKTPQLLSESQPQIICISGALNTMEAGQMLAVLEAAWSFASEALLFNFLSERAQDHDDSAETFIRRHNPAFMLDWALRHTPYAALRHDYFKGGHDATILMRHPK